ncbi:MAG: ATP-binding protein, partial [Gemmatimonadetes bacterium]|nr:ATP-binding protein [Gemmatimonadota bacterium]
MTEDLNPRFTFDAFVVGPNNRLAVTACRTVADHPGAAYNPLFIYSQTGLGKTHLLMAIGQRAQQLSSDTRVEYLTLDEFVESYHAAVSTGHPDEFRNRFAQASIVLLDDVQFLSHSKEMQAELIRMAGEFQQAERQLVLTSDRPPTDMENLDERLLEQLDGGLVVDIGLPEYETRLAILQRHADEATAEFAPDVLAAIADLDVQHVRALIGIFNRLQAFQSVHDNPLTPQQARALVLGEAPIDASPADDDNAERGEFNRFLSSLQATWKRRFILSVPARWRGLRWLDRWVFIRLGLGPRLLSSTVSSQTNETRLAGLRDQTLEERVRHWFWLNHSVRTAIWGSVLLTIILVEICLLFGWWFFPDQSGVQNTGGGVSTLLTIAEVTGSVAGIL